MNTNVQQGMLGADFDYESNELLIQQKDQTLDLRLLVDI